MAVHSVRRPVVPSVSTWQEISFKQPLVGWQELASRVESTSPPPHPSPNALRLAFWAGNIPLRAVRYGQQMVFDGARVKVWIKRGGYRPKRRGAR